MAEENIEMESLPRRSKQVVDEYSHSGEDQTSVAIMWSWFSAFLLITLAFILILSPRLLLFLAETGRMADRKNTLTTLESFLSLHFGILLLSVAITIFFNMPSSTQPVPIPSDAGTPNNALLVPLSLGCLLSSLLSYNAHGIGPLKDIVFFITGIIGIWGLWACLFADPAPKSKKTGADKHTSSFLFKNSASASEQKKKLRENQKTE